MSLNVYSQSISDAIDWKFKYVDVLELIKT